MLETGHCPTMSSSNNETLAYMMKRLVSKKRKQSGGSTQVVPPQPSEVPIPPPSFPFPLMPNIPFGKPYPLAVECQSPKVQQKGQDDTASTDSFKEAMAAASLTGMGAPQTHTILIQVDSGAKSSSANKDEGSKYYVPANVETREATSQPIAQVASEFGIGDAPTESKEVTDSDSEGSHLYGCLRLNCIRFYLLNFTFLLLIKCETIFIRGS